jgi:hypothetical protein
MFTNEPTRLIIDILMHKIKIVERMDKNLNPTGRLLLSLRISKNILCRVGLLSLSPTISKNFMELAHSHVLSGF